MSGRSRCVVCEQVDDSHLFSVCEECRKLVCPYCWDREGFDKTPNVCELCAKEKPENSLGRRNR